MTLKQKKRHDKIKRTKSTKTELLGLVELKYVLSKVCPTSKHPYHTTVEKIEMMSLFLNCKTMYVNVWNLTFV